MRELGIARAKANGQSLQQYLSAELDRLAATPTTAEWVARVQVRPRVAGITNDDVLAAIREGRGEG